jgi:hypothetical protein
VLPVVLIRHPLDRAFSVYSHLRRSPNYGQRSGSVAQATSFPRFVEWCLENRSLGGVVIADYQVIHLSPASFRGGHIFEAVATERDLEHAIDYLSGGPCCGTVDRFGAAMVGLRRAARDMGLSIPSGTVVENKTAGRPYGLDERLSLARNELGPELSSRFLRENELDYRLYEWASARQLEVGSPSEEIALYQTLRSSRNMRSSFSGVAGSES